MWGVEWQGVLSSSPSSSSSPSASPFTLTRIFILISTFTSLSRPGVPSLVPLGCSDSPLDREHLGFEPRHFIIRNARWRFRLSFHHPRAPDGYTGCLSIIRTGRRRMGGWVMGCYSSNVPRPSPLCYPRKKGCHGGKWSRIFTCLHGRQ